MNLHQFRFVREAVRQKLNLTEAARALHTSQPGVSKAILELEDELGVDIFTRHGKRLKKITEPGEQVLQSIEIILREVANLKRIGLEYSQQDSGTLSLATTHTQARYVLPQAVSAWRSLYPKVNISLHQGSPEQVASMVLDEVADMALATESLADFPELVSLPCYEWQHVVIFPANHPLASQSHIRLEHLTQYPLITYHPSFTGRARIDQAFASRRLAPQVVMEAIDADVIKTYVRLGLGVGIVAEMAMKDDAHTDLLWQPAAHLFGQNMARIAFRKGAYLRDYVYAFAQRLSPHLSRQVILQAMTAETSGSDPGL
jgi:LysR family cys regulon transcriptional activator